MSTTDERQRITDDCPYQCRDNKAGIPFAECSKHGLNPAYPRYPWQMGWVESTGQRA